MFEKFKELIGLDDEMEEIEDENVESGQEKEESNFTTDRPRFAHENRSSQKENKLLNLHTTTTTQSKLDIKTPNGYDEATVICDALKNRRIVVVNTTSLETKIAQRLLDFISGAAYVLGGEIQEVEKGVYVLAPSNVEVSKEMAGSYVSKRSFLDSED